MSVSVEVIWQLSEFSLKIMNYSLLRLIQTYKFDSILNILREKKLQ